MRYSFLATGLLVAAGLGIGAADAMPPIVATVSLQPGAPTGRARSLDGVIEIHNPGEVEITASARSFRSRLGYRVDVEREAVVVKPRDTMYLPFQLSIRGDGRYHVRIPVYLEGASRRPMGQVDGTLDLQVQGGEYKVEDYETLFVNPVDRAVDDDGTEVLVFRTGPPPAIAISREDIRHLWTVEQLSVDTEAAVRSIGTGSGEVQSPTLPLPPPKGGGAIHPDPIDDELTPEAIQARLDAIVRGGKRPGIAPTRNLIATGMTAQGSFKYTGLDGLLHNAWGWRVYARAVFGGSTVTLAKTNVAPNGTWSLSIPPVPDLFLIEIDYEPRNVYFTLRNVAGAYYRFSSGGLYIPVTNKVLNEYTQAAYLSNSDLVGLGEVHRDGMDFWDKLKTRGEGIDPVPASSLAIYYPNNSYDCGAGNGPWSCANPSGNIWIIPAHATGNVLMHELGHQLQYKYWNGGTPPGSGGSHTFTGCFTTGLALSEGFADFMLVWAKRARNQDPAAGGFADLDHPEDAGACTTKNKNEMWVAGTFWDFYDSLVDGQDTIYYTHTGAAPKLYLNSGVHSSMAEYLNIFKTIVSPQHLTIAGQIFTQNKQ